jgi:hypothetical protein
MVSAITRVWESRSYLSCHPYVTAHAIVWWEPISVISLSCACRLHIPPALGGLKVAKLL